MSDFFKSMFNGKNDFGNIFNEMFGDKVNPIDPLSKMSSQKPKYSTPQKPKNKKFKSEKTDGNYIVLKVPVPKLMSAFDIDIRFDTDKSIIYVEGNCPSGSIDKEYKVFKQVEKIVLVGIEYEHAIIRFYIKNQVPIYSTKNPDKVDI